MMNIEGKVAVVTGGTRGIGLAITGALLRCGAKVAIAARNVGEQGQITAALNLDYEDKVIGVRCDVGEFEAVRQLFKEVEERFGGVDILINNAGIGSFTNVEQLSIEEWNQIIGTNLTGVFSCCHAAIPLMKKRGGGYIINIGSLAGKEAFAGASAYCASKFGLVGFSEALMQEVRYDHIKVSYVMPGSVNTSFGRSGEQDPSTTWKLLPEDVAQVVIELLKMNSRALPSRIELRPAEPQKS